MSLKTNIRMFYCIFPWTVTLRKTFMTSALREFGIASTALTNHANISMTNKHYYDKEITREDAKENFSVFKKKKNLTPNLTPSSKKNI